MLADSVGGVLPPFFVTMIQYTVMAVKYGVAARACAAETKGTSKPKRLQIAHIPTSASHLQEAIPRPERDGVYVVCKTHSYNYSHWFGC